MDNANTLSILRQLERGEISATEADTRLIAPARIERVTTPPFDRAELPFWLRQIWITLLIAGIGIVVLGAWIIAATVHANVLWFLLGLPTVLFGSLLTAIGAGAFSGHWLYVNVENSRRRARSIRLAFPIPLGLVRLGLSVARWISPQALARVRTSLGQSEFDTIVDNPDELINALERELAAGNGITIDVDGKNERVQVYAI
jgi:hypothetical protein